jgi:RHS repeat-associated protein
VSTRPTKTYTYDAIGNMLSKSDVGLYSYAPPGGPRPHAVTGIDGDVLSTTFYYDANGNQTEGLGRSIAWTAANKPLSITQGTRVISFEDDIDHQRFKQVTQQGTTLYYRAFGVLAELVTGATSARWNEYLSVGNQMAGVRFVDGVGTATPTVTTRYFHTDHLGSIALLTNEAGALAQRLSYDPWGKRRFNNGADDFPGSLSSTTLTTRGFTGEEELSIGGLVHLNGRVYDPMLARMVSADPLVPDALNAQAWNRYSYVGNSPLTFTDPSGHSWLSSFFGSVGSFVQSILQNPIVRAVVQIAIAGLFPGGSLLWAIVGGAVSGAVVTGLAGGDLGDMLRAGAIAGATAAAFWGSGELGKTLPGANPGSLGQHGIPDFGSQAHAFSIASHAGIGCLSSVAAGGNCGSGALSGGVSAAASPVMPSNVFAHAAVGGLASVAGGGKFANGAVTGAFGYLYNAMGRCERDQMGCSQPEYGGAGGGGRGSIDFGAGIAAMGGRYKRGDWGCVEWN